MYKSDIHVPVSTSWLRLVSGPWRGPGPASGGRMPAHWTGSLTTPLGHLLHSPASCSVKVYYWCWMIKKNTTKTTVDGGLGKMLFILLSMWHTYFLPSNLLSESWRMEPSCLRKKRTNSWELSFCLVRLRTRVRMYWRSCWEHTSSMCSCSTGMISVIISRIWLSSCWVSILVNCNQQQLSSACSHVHRNI